LKKLDYVWDRLEMDFAKMRSILKIATMTGVIVVIPIPSSIYAKTALVRIAPSLLRDTRE